MSDHDFLTVIHCLDCLLYGTNLPGETRCGNCQSENTKVFVEAKEIERLEKIAALRKIQADAESYQKRTAYRDGVASMQPKLEQAQAALDIAREQIRRYFNFQSYQEFVDVAKVVEANTQLEARVTELEEGLKRAEGWMGPVFDGFKIPKDAESRMVVLNHIRELLKPPPQGKGEVNKPLLQGANALDIVGTLGSSPHGYPVRVKKPAPKDKEG